MKKAINRFVIQGNNSSFPIDALIHGEVDDFLFITRKQIEDIILSKRNIYSSAVHFGLLTCQPKNRCLNFNLLYEKDRYCIQIKWYNIIDSIIESMCK